MTNGTAAFSQKAFTRSLKKYYGVYTGGFVSFVILLPWVAVAGRVEIDAVQWSLIAALGVAGMALPYVIFARGIRNVPTQEAGLLLLLEPILNPVWVALAWGEENRTEVWIGGGLILSGLAVRYLLIPAGRALRQRRAGR